jgi:hypothetical protein
LATWLSLTSASTISVRKSASEAMPPLPPAPAVQPDAVATQGENKVLWVISGDGALRPTPIVTGAPVGNLIALREGPPPGTRVVRQPGPELRAGMRVKEKQ